MMKKNLEIQAYSEFSKVYERKIIKSKLSPVVIVGCQMRDTVYLIMIILLLSIIVREVFKKKV